MTTTNPTTHPTTNPTTNSTTQKLLQPGAALPVRFFAYLQERFPLAAWQWSPPMKRLTVCMVFLLNSHNSGGGAAKKRPLHGGIGGQGLEPAIGGEGRVGAVHLARRPAIGIIVMAPLR
jgi:hypothetical protein